MSRKPKYSATERNIPILSINLSGYPTICDVDGINFVYATYVDPDKLVGVNSYTIKSQKMRFYRNGVGNCRILPGWKEEGITILRIDQNGHYNYNILAGRLKETPKALVTVENKSRALTTVEETSKELVIVKRELLVI